MKRMTNKTLIRGIFREISILGIPVFIDSGNESECCYIHLLNDSSSQADDTHILEISTYRKFDENITIRFELDNHMYEASLKQNEENRYGLPDQIEISDKRKKNRILATDIARGQMIAEVRGAGWREIGLVRDFTEDRMAILVKKTINHPAIDTQVTVYVYKDGKEIYYGTLWVQAIRFVSDQENLFVFSTFSSRHFKQKFKERHHGRIETESNITVNCLWPDEDGINLNATIIDHGFGGFRAQIDKISYLPPVGSILILKGTRICIRLAWIEGDTLGFDIRLNDREQYGEWIHLSATWRKNALSTTPQAAVTKRIVSTLLRSGYLHGLKAINIQSQISQEALLTQNLTNNRWIRRFSSSTGLQLLDHVSFLKLADSSWLIQELGNASEQRGTAESLIVEAMLDLYAKESAFQGSSTVLLALYQRDIKFNQRFWREKAKKSDYPEFPAYVGSVSIESIANLGKRLSEETFCVAPRMNDWDSVFVELNELYHESLLSGLGITRDSFNSPTLARDLASSGFILKRQVYLLYERDRISGLFVIFGLPTFSNLTISANHLWLISTDPEKASDYLEAIVANDNLKNVLHGVTQIVLITNQHEHSSINEDIFKFRPFFLLSIPFHQITKFLSTD